MLGQQTVAEVRPLANGNIVVAGTVTKGVEVNDETLAVAELLPDGRLDRSFGQGGVEITRIKLLPWQILALGDGRLLILGPNRPPGAQEPVITSFPDWQVLRLLKDGRPDPSFGRGGLLNVAGVPVATEGASAEIAPGLTSGGDIVLPTIIGRLFSPSMTSGLVRLNPDGLRDSGFGSDGLVKLGSVLTAFSPLPDGSAVVTLGRSGVELARLTDSGAPDPSFDDGAAVATPIYGVDSLLVQPDGTIELHGYPSANSLVDNRIWSYTPTGALDTSWGVGGSVDLGSPTGYLDQLLAARDGGTLLVTMGFRPSVANGGSALPEGYSGVRVDTLTAGGQFDQTAGGSNGLSTALPFGGTTYAPGAVAHLNRNTFAPVGVSALTNGDLLFSGTVDAAEESPTNAGPQTVAVIDGFALAALNPSVLLDPIFTAGIPLRLSASVNSTRLSRTGISVALRSSDAAVAVVTVVKGGMTIARGSVPFFSIGQLVSHRTARIALTHAGVRLLNARRARVTVRVTAEDLVGNRVTTTTSATLSG